MKDLISKINKEYIVIFNITIIIGIIIFCIAITPITLQNDTFYTIKIGEDILKNGIDMQDHYSWHENLAYTYPHWAYDVFTYIVYSIGGYAGIYILTIILTIILGILIYLTQTKISKNNLTSAFVTFGVLYLLRPYIAARAQLVTFILFVLTIYFIEMFLKTKHKRYGIGLIIIPFVIANVHLAVFPFYFILYLPYVAEYIIATVRDLDIIPKICIFINNKKIKYYAKKGNKENQIEELRQRNKIINLNLIKFKAEHDEKRKHPYKVIIDKNKIVIYLILIMVISLYTGFLTPLKGTPYSYLINTMQGNTTKNISEHLPITLINNKPILLLITGIISLLIFTNVKIKLRDLFMLGGLCLLTLMSRRQASMFVLIGAYTVNKMISELFEEYDSKGTEKILKISSPVLSRIIILLVIILGSVSILKPKLKDKFVDVKAYPVEASKYIKENLDLDNIKLYNEYNYGSYLLFKGIPVFIDSRADLYAPEFNKVKQENGEYLKRDIFTDYINVSSVSKFYEDIFEKYGITHVIVSNKSKITMFLKRDENYKELYKDDSFVIFERMNTVIE